MVSGRLKRVERLLVGPATVIAEITAFVVFVLVALFAVSSVFLYSAYFLGCVTLCLLSLSAATIRMVARDVRVTRARKRAVIRGGTVLHIGLVLALVFSAAVLLGVSQGIYVALEGETLPAGSAPVTLVRGPLAPPFVLPEAMTLLRVSPSWWDDGTLRQLSSELSLGSPARPVSLAVNGSRTISGVRYFQDQRFGPAYLLTLTGPDGSVQKRRVDLPQPDAGAPTYLDVQVADGVICAQCRVRLHARHRHDPDRQDVPVGAGERTGVDQRRVDRTGRWLERPPRCLPDLGCVRGLSRAAGLAALRVVPHRVCWCDDVVRCTAEGRAWSIT